ncbi:IPT/TIG domain-containing protein [Dactylosporangium sp. CA-233914]|uniref:IPT/TIG domain-containing protein n=1 Tax=Dactylosporangium sp. CA-233914 TaxID=3239934 RepID=UPI003D8AF40E
MLVLGAFTLATAGPGGPAAEHESGSPALAGAVTQPVVSGVNPSSGFTTGGTTVTITGTGFTGATAVTFNGTDATSFTVVSPTEITAVTPAGAMGPALVQVAIGTCISSVSGGTFTYLPQITPPLVSSMSPTSGPTVGGTTVTISGTNLSGAMSVTFGGVAGTVSNSTATSITAVTPAHAAGNVAVGVTTLMGATTVPGGYTYVAGPGVSSLSPTSGPTAGGTSVAITGAGFTGATAVDFGTDPAASFTVNSDTSITAVAPAHSAGAVDVAVTTPSGTANATGAYTYTPPPSVTSLSPTSGATAGGTSVTITGAGFTGTTAVDFGTDPAASFTVNSDTSITAVAPAHSAGAVDVAVTTPSGTANATGAYTYMPPPSVTSLSPTSGLTAGGTSVTITGTGFTGTTAVDFGTDPAASFTVDSDTSITAITPAEAAGAVDVQVTTPGGTATAVGAYTYMPAATATSIFPTSGPDLGGTLVAITGTGFTGTTAVTFDGMNATSFTVNSDTTISAVTPPGTGPVSVTVTTPTGSPSVPGGYEYVGVQAATLAAHSVHKDAAQEPAGTDAKQAHKAGANAKAKVKHKADATAAPRMKKVFFRMPTPACPAPPSAPSPVTATAGTSSVNVSWTAATPHDSPVTGYTATATPGPATCTTLVTDPDPLSCVLGATAGQQYTVSVVANSAAGASDPATSNAVTPAAPAVPATPPDTPLNLTTDKGAISTAEPGQDIVVIGTGFAAYSTATITLYSEPVTLGTVVTDGSGDFSKPVTVPHSLAAGVHTLVAQGVAPSGNPRAMKLTVTVAASAASPPSPASPPTGGLPVTGAPTGPLALAGLAMVLAGFGLLRPWHRRMMPGLR